MLLYLSMHSATAQVSPMAPYCTNCPSCAASHNCFYFCSYGYYYSGTSCYIYWNMAGCIAANGFYCVSCNPNYYLSSSYVCIICSSVIPNCLTCSNPVYCSQCVSGYTINSITNTCDSCSLNISNCAICISKFVCTSCIDQTYFVNSTYKC